MQTLKTERYIRTLKTLYPNLKTLYKKNIQTLKTLLYPNSENVISELRQRYIGTLKKLYQNLENVLSELENVTSKL